MTVIELDVSDLGPITAPVLCGIVQDSSGNAVVNALVTASNGTQTYTNDSGYYEMPVCEGEYWVEASKSGYSSQRMNHIYVYAEAGTMAQPIIIK